VGRLYACGYKPAKIGLTARSTFAISAAMKRSLCLLLFLAGCSTAPIADFLDLVDPAKGVGGNVEPHGGVCNPTPAIGAPAPGAPTGTRIPPLSGGDVPPPEPPAVSP